MDADADPTNEIQDIVFDGVDLSISSGSTVDLSVLQDGTTDADADPNNEIQTLSINVDQLSISGGNTLTLPGVGGSGDNLGDHTATANIELGNFWLSGDGDSEGISVSNSGNVGIGASSMQGELDVAGTIFTTGGMYFSDPSAANPTSGGESVSYTHLRAHETR